MNQKTIMQIIKKVRKMYKFTPYKEIVEQDASIELSEQDGKLVLYNIVFSFYDAIHVTNHSITFYPEHGNSQTLLKYGSIEEFLKM